MSGHKEAKEISKLRTRLALENAINRRLDELLQAAGRQVYLLHDDRAMRENQIRNVLDVAMSKPSIDVVTNFIRYQMGRSGGNQAWLHNKFGQKVVEDIEKGIVPRLAAGVADEVCQEVQEADRDEVVREARLRLVRLYLGYLNRWFYYGFKTKRWDDILEATKEAVSNVR